jgi:hypothetical protein
MRATKNGSVRVRAARLFYPQEQTSSARPGMSVWCHEQTWRGVFHLLVPGERWRTAMGSLSYVS